MLFILTGILVLISGAWYYPRTLRHVRSRVAERGQPTETLDTAIRLRWLFSACGLVLVAVGISVVA